VRGGSPWVYIAVSMLAAGQKSVVSIRRAAAGSTAALRMPSIVVEKDFVDCEDGVVTVLEVDVKFWGCLSLRLSWSLLITSCPCE